MGDEGGTYGIESLYMVGLRGSVEWEFSHIALSDRRFAQTGWLR